MGCLAMTLLNYCCTRCIMVERSNVKALLGQTIPCKTPQDAAGMRLTAKLPISAIKMEKLIRHHFHTDIAL